MAGLKCEKKPLREAFFFCLRDFLADAILAYMVQSGFTRKKVESLTLGEKLRKLRMDFRMSLQDVSKATRIQSKYLEALENGAYELLPADVYVRGFLRSYARYLNVDEEALVKLYERERNIKENLGQDHPSRPTSHGFTPLSFVITSRTLIVSLIGLLVFGAFFYLYREFRSFAAEPALVLLEPQNGAVVEDEEIVVRGKTDKGAQVTLNDQNIFVDNDGLFSDKLFLRAGMNTITVRTTNRFNKEKVVTYTIESRRPVLEVVPQIESIPPPIEPTN
jgi:transcriptional regulator with XRE-family HTH domain